MTTEEIRELCRRALLEGMGRRDLAAIDELFAPELVEMIKKHSKMWHTATPDFRYTVEDVIVEGNKGVVSWTATSTHTGVLWGIAPSGKKVKDAGIVIMRIEDGKIVEFGGYWSVLDFLIQLGAIPPMIAPNNKAWRTWLK